MKKNVLFAIVIVFLNFSPVFAQGIEFFHGTWEEALEKAKEEDKIIFVDSYTTWCGPCRRMQNNIFPEKAAGDFYNKNFINIKMNMETQEGMKFGLSYPVGAYPTLQFIAPDGKIVFSKVGGQDLEKFLGLGKKALKAYDKTPDLAKEWEKGNRNYSFVLKYIKALNSAGKSANKVALDYMREGRKISLDEKTVLLFEATSECDSKLFETLTKKKFLKNAKEIYSEDEISDKIYNACWKTYERSIEYDVQELEEEAKKKLKKYNKKRYKEFSKKIDLVNAENKNDIDEYIKAAKNYFKVLSNSKDKAKFLSLIGNKFRRDTKIKELAEDFALNIYKKDKTAQNYTTYIKILINNQKFSEALKCLGKAMKIANDTSDDESKRTLKRYQRYLQKVEK